MSWAGRPRGQRRWRVTGADRKNAAGLEGVLELLIWNNKKRLHDPRTRVAVEVVTKSNIINLGFYLMKCAKLEGMLEPLILKDYEARGVVPFEVDGGIVN